MAINEFIDPRFTFENFVVASNNESCVLAGKRVAEQPGELYNPLYIHGGEGLGKTHLLHAIANALTATGHANIVCQSAQRFSTGIVTAMRDDALQAFRHRYRDADVLLMDDIHFLAGKTSTQDELLRIFDAHHDSKKQLVLASNFSPEEMGKLDERILSLVRPGLSVEMTIPDLETRIAILKKKAMLAGIRLDDDVSHLLASRFTTNIRELEGKLTRLLAYAALTDKGINMDLAKRVLEDLPLGEGKRNSATID